MLLRSTTYSAATSDRLLTTYSSQRESLFLCENVTIDDANHTESIISRNRKQHHGTFREEETIEIIQTHEHPSQLIVHFFARPSAVMGYFTAHKTEYSIFRHLCALYLLTGNSSCSSKEKVQNHSVWGKQCSSTCVYKGWTYNLRWKLSRIKYNERSISSSCVYVYMAKIKDLLAFLAKREKDGNATCRQGWREMGNLLRCCQECVCLRHLQRETSHYS